MNAKERFIRRLVDVRDSLPKGSEAALTLADIIDDLASARVKVTQARTVQSSPVPNYNPKRDGDYSRWLVSHNID
jgi:hypothetical protein